ncbi:MAG: Asp-tRNA(Asn)/Glu-tRNA(Gln) amidotransferase GatCAB subunit C, partial [Desulfobacterales bacterium]|nr:Asp-tRNA(Asn)/Glu-tRNA(Gln) amidotransferase GatCAB subunit C [Desulfobacterales bacterium]
TSSIREVTAFPKNRSAYCPLTQAPSDVSRQQLVELDLLDSGEKRKLPGSEEQHTLIDSLAWVSRIGINDGQRPKIGAAIEEARQLAEIINGYSEKEEPIFSVTDISNRMRKKAVVRHHRLAKSGEIFRNAPAVKGNYFKVASILE